MFNLVDIGFVHYMYYQAPIQYCMHPICNYATLMPVYGMNEKNTPTISSASDKMCLFLSLKLLYNRKRSSRRNAISQGKWFHMSGLNFLYYRTAHLYSMHLCIRAKWKLDLKKKTKVCSFFNIFSPIIGMQFL